MLMVSSADVKATSLSLASCFNRWEGSKGKLNESGGDVHHDLGDIQSSYVPGFCQFDIMEVSRTFMRQEYHKEDGRRKGPSWRKKARLSNIPHAQLSLTGRAEAEISVLCSFTPSDPCILCIVISWSLHAIQAAPLETGSEVEVSPRHKVFWERRYVTALHLQGCASGCWETRTRSTLSPPPLVALLRTPQSTCTFYSVPPCTKFLLTAPTSMKT